jgi:hypothetical protein
MAVPIAIPCKVLVSSYAAPNAKSKALKDIALSGESRTTLKILFGPLIKLASEKRRIIIT